MKSKYVLLLVISIFAVSWQGLKYPLSPRPGKDYALFFAMDDYSGTPGFSSLKNPGKDADALAGELKAMYGFDPKVYKNYTKAQIYQVLESWQKKTFADDAQLFIFFSGHGTFWEFTKKGYFVPKGSPNDYSAYIELTDLGNIVTQIPCKHILLAIDACYSGTIDQAIAFKGNEPFRRPNQNQNTERDNLIYRQLRNSSRLLLTSGGKERTPDGATNSPFAAAMLKGLRAAYTYGDGLFTYADLLSALERVSPTPHQGELPGHEQGGFVFVTENPSAPVTPPQPRIVEPPKPTVPDDFVLVKGGTFQMGDQFGDGYDIEKPVHSVSVSDFYMSKYEVTVGEYLAFANATGKNQPAWMEKGSKYNIQTGNDNPYKKLGSALTNERNPIVGVSWYDAVAYCNWRSRKEGFQEVYTINGDEVKDNWTASGYRLPIEAEWEYGALSRGQKEKWAGTSTESELALYANYYELGTKDKYPYTAPVGTYFANALDLHDMSGNVLEWCWDWYGDTYYGESNNSRDPRGPASGTFRVVRGGSWDFNPLGCRAAYRFRGDPLGGKDDVGFRLVRH